MTDFSVRFTADGSNFACEFFSSLSFLSCFLSGPLLQDYNDSFTYMDSGFEILVYFHLVLFFSVLLL